MPVKPDVRLYLHEATADRHGSGYFTVRLLVGYIASDGKLRSPSRSGLWSSHAPEVATAGYENLELSGQANRDETRLYGYDRLRYRDMYALDERDLELMLKTIKRVHRHIERLNTRFGYPEDFAGYAARVADAIGVTSERPFGVRADAAHDYDGTGWRWLGVDGLRVHLAGLLDAWAPRATAEPSTVSD